jgi:hypothetical protein
MYSEAKKQGQSFNELLEQNDPSQNYDGELAKLSAFERQLAANEIKVNSKDAALIDQFFATSNSKVLFPEFVSQKIQIGMRLGRRAARLEDVVSVTNTIDSNSYNTSEIDLDYTDVKYKRVVEGGNFPVAKFRTKEKAVTLYKVGLKIDASYEALRRMKASVLSVALVAMGIKLGQDLTYEALLTLLNGDGNSNPAGNINSAVTGNLTFDDLLELDFAFDDGFDPDLVIGNKSAIKKVLKITEFKDPAIAADFLTKGEATTPFGLNFKTNNRLPDGKLLGINKISGIEMLEEKGGQLVEADKIIDKQIQGSVISKVVGFSKIFKNSANTLTYVW